jgi:hypothetical protein
MLPPTAERPPFEIDMAPPSPSEIVNAIKRLKNNKPPGEYSLPPEVYKASPHVVIEQLDTFFSLIWEKKTFPSDWKVSAIIPVFKKGDICDSRNYRGISLMDMATKVFSMILLKRFEEARDERTRENQCGYRKGRGCTDQVFTLHLILQQCERYKLPIINMFLDFVAAFDSVTSENLW